MENAIESLENLSLTNTTTITTTTSYSELRIGLLTLPDELLVQIIQHVLPSRISVVSLSLVSQRLLFVSRDPLLWKKIDFSKYKDRINNQYFCRTIQRHKGSVKKLDVSGCYKLSHEALKKIGSRLVCSSLTSISLRDLKSVKSSSWGDIVLKLSRYGNQIQHLDLSHNYLSDKMLNYFSFFPNLSSLCLTKCFLHDFTPLYSCSTLTSLNISQNFSVNGLDALLRSLSNLKVLNASGQVKTEQDYFWNLDFLLAKPNTTLQVFSFDSELPFRSLENFECLTDLSISDSFHVNMDLLSFNSIPKVSTVRLSSSGNNAINSLPFSPVFSNLKHLFISGNFHLLWENFPPSLETLVLSFFSVTSSNLYSAINLLPNLRTLKVRYSTTLQSVALNLVDSKLTVLSITQCNSLHTFVLKEANKITSLDLSGNAILTTMNFDCQNLHYLGLKSLPMELIFIGKMKFIKLKHVRLRRVDRSVEVDAKLANPKVSPLTFSLKDETEGVDFYSIQTLEDLLKHPNIHVLKTYNYNWQKNWFDSRLGILLDPFIPLLFQTAPQLTIELFPHKPLKRTAKPKTLKLNSRFLY